MLPLSETDSIKSSSYACRATAIILHFAVFSCFLWMMNNAVYLYLAYATVNENNCFFIQTYQAFVKPIRFLLFFFNAQKLFVVFLNNSSSGKIFKSPTYQRHSHTKNLKTISFGFYAKTRFFCSIITFV